MLNNSNFSKAASERENRSETDLKLTLFYLAEKYW